MGEDVLIILYKFKFSFGTVNDEENASQFCKGKNLRKKIVLRKAGVYKLKKIKNRKNENQMEVDEDVHNEDNFEEETKFDYNNLHSDNRTVIIKNITTTTTEEDIKQFILNYNSAIGIADIRIVKDKKGISKGFAFVDLINEENALKCANILNNKILNENIITCAISKPPKLG